MIERTLIHWNIYIGQEIEPGRYMVLLSNEAMKVATFGIANGWTDEAGASLRPAENENFVVAYAGAENIEHQGAPK